MTLEQLQEKQERERMEFAAAQVREWEKLKERLAHIGLREDKGSNQYEDFHTEERQKEIDKHNEQWGSDGKFAQALKQRHEKELLKQTGQYIAPERAQGQTNDNQPKIKRRGWGR